MSDARSRRGRGSPSDALSRAGRDGALLLAVFLAHALGRSDAYGWTEGGLAGGIAALLAAAVMRAQRERLPRLPVVEWMCLHYYAIWVFPIFLPGGAHAGPLSALRASGLLAGALVGVLVFVVAALVGLRTARLGAGSPRAPTPPRPASRPVLVGLAVATVVATSLGTMLVGRHGASFALTLLASPILVLVLLTFELRRSPPWRLGEGVLAATAAAVVCLGLGTGSLERALLPVLLLFFLGPGARASARLRYVAVAAALVVFMVPLSTAYRSLAGLDELTILGAEAPSEGIRGAIASRSAGSDALRITADTLRVVPDQVFYAEGETWAPVLVNWIPRALWPGKPSLGTLAADSLQAKLDYEHAIRVPAVAEGYYNFGWIGVAVAGLAAGLYFGVLARVFDPNSRFRYALAVFAMAMARPTETIAIPLGAVLQTAFAVALMVGLVELAAGAPRLLSRLRARDRHSVLSDGMRA